MLGVALLLGGLVLGPPQLSPAPEPETETETETETEPGPATHGQLRVRVTVHGTRDGVPGARLLELEPAAGAGTEGEPTTTDEHGAAQLWLEPGSHRFSVRAEGYEPAEFEVEISLGERQVLTLRLDEALGGNPYRTVVRTERVGAVSHTTLREQELHELPGSGGDPFGVIKSLPGAAQVTGFLPYVVVRGAAPGNTGYYLDGVRIPALFHVAVGPSVVHLLHR